MDSEFAGMTVNERLYVSGLMDAFDAAVEEKNSEKVRAILEKVELTELNIDRILKQLGV